MAAAKALLALVVLACALGVAWAGGAAITVDAGPAQVLAFPATDVTLFGRVSGVEDQPVVVEWALADGPAPVVFSAPWALTTTATFSQAGTYLLRLTARRGASEAASTVVVTVNPASSQRAFYVDPDFVGESDGSEGRPWKSLVSQPDGPEWSAVNRALADGPVIIYFSAREAGEEVSEETTSEVNVLRTDRGTHRLTLDGMSKYNADDTHPSWRDYHGPCRLRIRILRGSLSIGSHGNQTETPMHYVTVRGFETTGSSGRVTFGGSHCVMEHMYIHDITAVGANLQFHGSVESDGTETFGRLTDITIRNNRIERGMGEGIYIAGNYRTKAYGGWPEYGNTHSNLLIEGNIIRDPGINGEEGDGIDVKTGIQNVTIRGNLIEHMHPLPDVSGIVFDGVFGNVRSDYLIENNRIHDAGHGMMFGGQNGVTIRNNVVTDCVRGGIYASGDPDSDSRNRDVRIYNNSVLGGGIGIGASIGVILRNNLALADDRPRENGGYQFGSWGSSGIDSDYNLISAPGPESGWQEGPHSSIVAGPASLVVDPASADLCLVPSSPAIGKGLDLSATGFACDIRKVARPQGRAWDIGSCELEAPGG